MTNQRRIFTVLTNQRPAFYLGVEEASDPEDLGSAVIAPALELPVPLQQLREPEAQGGGQPGDLLPVSRDPGVIHWS